jgi:hypothetical protein
MTVLPEPVGAARTPKSRAKAAFTPPAGNPWAGPKTEIIFRQDPPAVIKGIGDTVFFEQPQGRPDEAPGQEQPSVPDSVAAQHFGHLPVGVAPLVVFQPTRVGEAQPLLELVHHQGRKVVDWEGNKVGKSNGYRMVNYNIDLPASIDNC